MSNISSFPYNLTVLSDAQAPVDYLSAINIASGTAVIPFILAMVFFTAYYVLDRQQFTVPSCIAYASYITFIMGLMGRLIVIGGVPLVETYIIIFLIIIMASSTVYLIFSNER